MPEDVALIGAGNQMYSDLLRVPFSTIDQDSRSVGEQAAEVLLDRMVGQSAPAPRLILMPLTVVARDSSRKPILKPAASP